MNKFDQIYSDYSCFLYVCVYACNTQKIKKKQQQQANSLIFKSKFKYLDKWLLLFPSLRRLFLDAIKACVFRA